jgi:hypothetical protein
MGLFVNIAAGLRALMGREKVEREMDEELSSFLNASTEDKLRAGMTVDQAAYAARVEMGSTNAVKHQVWSARWESTFEGLLQDTRISLRMLVSRYFRWLLASVATQPSFPSSTRSCSAIFPCAIPSNL